MQEYTWRYIQCRVCRPRERLEEKGKKRREKQARVDCAGGGTLCRQVSVSYIRYQGRWWADAKIIVIPAAPTVDALVARQRNRKSTLLYSTT